MVKNLLGDAPGSTVMVTNLQRFVSKFPIHPPCDDERVTENVCCLNMAEEDEGASARD